MSCLHIPIPKKLKQLPSSSKKAWKSLTSSIQPSVDYLHDHLKIPSSISRIARRLLHRRPKHHRGIAKGSLHHYYKSRQHYQYQHLHPSSSVPANPATVYVDRLFDESTNHSSGLGTASTSRGHAGSNYATRVNEDHKNRNVAEAQHRRKSAREKMRNMEASNVNWKEYVSSLPKIQGVDERAQEFISKFRQQMQLQREQSLLDFQQMLDRSA